MTIAQRVAAFFQTLSEVWEVVPKPIKVALYVGTATALAQWALGPLDVKEIILAIAFNLGLYKGPGIVNNVVQKMAK